MPERNVRYAKTPVYTPGKETFWLWPFLTIVTTAVHLFLRTAIVGADLVSPESGVVGFTGLMSFVLCLWLDHYAKKAREASLAAKGFKFWGFTLVVAGIGVSLMVHYVSIGMEKRAERMHKAVTINTAGVNRAQDMYLEQLAKYDSCTERFSKMKRRDKEGLTVKDVCTAPVAPAPTVVTDMTTGLNDMALYESLALGLLALVCLADIIIYARGINVVSTIAEGAFYVDKKQAGVTLGSTVSLPRFPGDGVE